MFPVYVSLVEFNEKIGLEEKKNGKFEWNKSKRRRLNFNMYEHLKF